MTSSTLVKRATAAPSLVLCKTTIARAAGKLPGPYQTDKALSTSCLGNRRANVPVVVTPGPVSIKNFSSDSKDDVPRTSTGEPQKLNNLASEIGKKMAEAAPGGESSSPAVSGSGQGSDRQDSNNAEKGKPGEKE